MMAREHTNRGVLVEGARSHGLRQDASLHQPGLAAKVPDSGRVWELAGAGNTSPPCAVIPCGRPWVATPLHTMDVELGILNAKAP